MNSLLLNLIWLQKLYSIKLFWLALGRVGSSPISTSTRLRAPNPWTSNKLHLRRFLILMLKVWRAFITVSSSLNLPLSDNPDVIIKAWCKNLLSIFEVLVQCVIICLNIVIFAVTISYLLSLSYLSHGLIKIPLLDNSFSLNIRCFWSILLCWYDPPSFLFGFSGFLFVVSTCPYCSTCWGYSTFSTFKSTILLWTLRSFSLLSLFLIIVFRILWIVRAIVASFALLLGLGWSMKTTLLPLFNLHLFEATVLLLHFFHQNVVLEAEAGTKLVELLVENLTVRWLSCLCLWLFRPVWPYCTRML